MPYSKTRQNKTRAPFVVSLIVGRLSPEERLEELLNGTALTDPKQREALLDTALLGQLDCKVDRFLELLC